MSIKKIEYSKYQKDIFDWVETSTGNAIIKAVAGSGKTFTLCETMNRIKGNCVFLAFNKSIADELKKKVPSHVKACTLHSMGYSAVRYHFGYVPVDMDKVCKIMDNISGLRLWRGMKFNERKDILMKRTQIKKLVSLVKMCLIDYKDNAAVDKAADFYNVEYDADVLGYFRTVFQKSIEDKKCVDFDDMIYFPVIYNLKMLQYDWVMIDESQDLNRVQIEMVLKLAKSESGRVIAVGDPKQSIYGFRGADSEAMPRLQSALNAKELPLSVCYRCPTSHIELAQSLVPYIESAPDAIAGEINHIKDSIFESEIIKEKNPLVLCRINAPLMGYALSLISKGYKATIKGKDIGKSLITLVNNFPGDDSIENIYSQINNWESKELSKLYKKDAPESHIETIKDKAATLIAIADSCNNRQCIINKIESIFTDDKVDGIEFSSVHKAKGLEANSVYILLPHLLPLIRENQKPWELEQEYNIKYVALTRAKQKLVFVNSTKR